jgi:Holliday junction resolvase RusA-like endonuclease
MTATVARVRAEGRPAPKGSRIQGRDKAGRSYTRPASKYEKPWVDAVKEAAELQARHVTVTPPYVVDVQIYVQATKHKPAHWWPAQSDVDKLARAVIDGLVFGGAIDDDRNVAELHAVKRFCEPGEPPGCLVYIATAQPRSVVCAA